MKLMLPGSLFGMPLSGPRGGWRRHAACRREDPELFLPICTTGPARARITATKAVCAAARSEACPRFATEQLRGLGRAHRGRAAEAAAPAAGSRSPAAGPSHSRRLAG